MTFPRATEEERMTNIRLSSVEIQSGLDRVRYAEGLIRQLPENHDGRNTWLLNYGVSDEATDMRKKRDIAWVAATKCAESAS